MSKPDETGLLTEITEERWVSRTLDISMSKTERGFVLWDVSKRLIRSKHSETGEIETNQLLDDDIHGIKQKISDFVGIMPFNDISQIPPGYEWTRVNDDPEVSEGIEIYELKSEAIGYKRKSLRKWLVFADAKKNLPQKIEWYKKSADDVEFVLITVQEFEYWDDSEMQKAIEAAGF